MIAFLVIVLLTLVGILTYCVYALTNYPGLLRSEAEAEIRLHGAQRSRQLTELKRSIRRDTRQAREEFDAELEGEIDE